MTNYDTLSKNMAESHMWPPSRDNEYYFHRGSWWNNYPLIQECFGGEIKEIRTAVKASQFLQYEMCIRDRQRTDRADRRRVYGMDPPGAGI